MTDRSTQVALKPTPSTPAHGLQLQRKCACGSRTVGGGECEGCARHRAQRPSQGRPAIASMPESIQQAMGRADAPSHTHTRHASMPGLGHDFSQLGVHGGHATMRSARALHAASRAVGLSEGQSAPFKRGDRMAALDSMARISARNPGAAAPTGDEILSLAPTPTPTPAPGGAAPAAAAPPKPPAQKCTVTSGPSYSSSGRIPVTTTGGNKRASFDFSASFGEAHGALERLGLGLRTGFTTGAGIGAYFLGVGAIPGAIIGGLIGGIAGLAGSDSAPSCCEVRQFVRWDATSAAAMGGVPHGGFPSSTPPDTWIEDRDMAGTRYGHRTGPFSAPMHGDQYTSNGAVDTAKGNEYQGHDGPGGPAALLQGEWQFQLKVVDACHGDAEKASSSVITVPWS